MSRPSGRKRNELREVIIEPNVNKYAEGSCLISCGNTKVLCTATIEEKVPAFLKNAGKGGWVTAEYSMLPRSSQERIQREISVGKPNSRTTEIQRLIGRSLRACMDMKTLGERQIIIDCDVLQADGGTRCASITGGYVALNLAVQKMMRERHLKINPITGIITAVSCGIYKGNTVLDLDYEEDSNSDADVNFIINDKQELVEVQGTAEGKPFGFSRLDEMYKLALEGIDVLMQKQREAIK
ncbi:MAG TPA: ribonuclease PH [Rickettsiales bacterium]|nr:ribonuclease PH [Rickettsiales bacterium]